MLVLGVIEIPLWVLIAVGILALLYHLGTKNHDYFKKRGIRSPTPYPFIGNIYLLFKHDFYSIHANLKKDFGKFYGFLSGKSPNYVVFDEEMLSQIMVKQFQNFADRRPFLFSDPVLDNMLTMVKGERWKVIRSQMSPAFTTGKLKMMTPEINRGGKAFANKLVNMGGPFDARECAGAFTMDVIASSAFGLRIDSQGDKNNQFVINGKKMANFDALIFITIAILFPWLLPHLPKLGYNIMDPDAIKFFTAVVDQTFKGRLDAGSDTSFSKSNADFLQLMVEAQQGHDITDKDEKTLESVSDKGMSKDEILANALLFFLGGFDTTAAALSFLMYNLACNPDIQQKLITEIDQVLGEKDEVDYEAAGQMHYLDQCINESLRIFPSLPFVDRETKVDSDVCGYRIEKGSVIAIPILAIHKDPEIWPEPDRFDPDRFSPENKPNISPFHWMPFGYGPRNCIGMRLALFEIKVAIASLLKTHRLVTTEKTEIPLKLSKRKMMHPLNGVWIAVEKR